MKKLRNDPELKKAQWKSQLSFECLGVKIGVRSTDTVFVREFKKKLESVLPVERRLISETEVEHWFSIIRSLGPGKKSSIYRGAGLLSKNISAKDLTSQLESQIRITVAEFAKNYVFLHAGVVGWKGKAIVVPGKSFSGKTTLIAELVKRDCEYYSDEYAVIDKDGFVHPFPKKLSIRGIIDDFQQLDFEVEELGGRRARDPIPVGFLLMTEYKKSPGRTNIEVKKIGDAVMSSVANSISVRQNPEFVLKVLSEIAQRSTILKTERGEAKEFVDLLLNFLEENADGLSSAPGV
jgi:hypothetical protein